VIVLSDNVCFIKDFALPHAQAAEPSAAGQPIEQKPAESKSEELKKEMLEHQELFIERVPFEVVSVQTAPLASGERVYAANQELLDSMKLVFEQHGFYVDSIIPGGLFGNNFGNQTMLTPATAQLILQSLPGVKKYNMHAYTPKDEAADMKEVENKEKEESAKVEQDVVEPETQEKRKSKVDKKRLIMLSGVFGFLIIILVVVYITSNQPASTSVRAQPVSSVEPVTNP
jgi:hypothetical protein